MGSKRDKFIALGKAGGNRKDFFNLAKSEGLTDKEKLAKKTINNPKTKVFATASKLNMPGTEKTKTIKKAYGLMKMGSKLMKGTGEQDIQGDPISGEGLLIEPKMVDRDDKSHGGLIKGKPRLAKKGWR